MLPIYLSALETEEERAKMSEIYEAYEPLMLRYAIKITQNRHLAEDAVHDAFLAVIKHKEKYFSLSCRDFRASIVIIVKNKCIDHLRRAKAIAYEHIDDMALESMDIPIEEQIALREEYETLRKYIAELDETSQIVLEMKYILNMSYKEIAVELDLTQKHVDVKIMRAKEKIRKLMARKGDSIGQGTN